MIEEMTGPQISKKRIKVNKPANDTAARKVKRPDQKDRFEYAKQDDDSSLPDDVSHPDYDPASDGVINPNKP